MNWWDEDLGSSIACYPDHLEEGAAACDRLLSGPGLPSDVEDAARRNATWYAEVFPSTHLWSETGFFNPSIAADPDGNLKMILRTANYTLHPGGFYEYPPEDHGVIKTTNLIADVDVAGTEAEVTNVQVIDDRAVVHRPSPFPVEGIEDLRLFWLVSWHVLGTVRDRDAAGICTQLFCTLDDGKLGLGHTISLGHSHDKNWMPIVGYGAVIDRVYPLVMRPVLPPRIVHEMVDAPFIARSFRGGAQVFWWPEAKRWLGLVHESVGFPEDPEHWRVYTHRWLGWNSKWNLKDISRPFSLGKTRSIEFAAGMVRQGDDVLVSYGANDASAHLIRVKLEDIARAWKISDTPIGRPVMSNRKGEEPESSSPSA